MLPGMTARCGRSSCCHRRASGRALLKLLRKEIEQGVKDMRERKGNVRDQMAATNWCSPCRDLGRGGGAVQVADALVISVYLEADEDV